jgi:dephospho-CoA kinase
MKILGILGGVASGKSLVARQLANMGALVLDADRAGHETLRLPQIEEAARQRWGNAVFGPDGHIDRARLAKIVFAPPPDGPRERKYLEALTHPEIGRRLSAQAALFNPDGCPLAVTATEESSSAKSIAASSGLHDVAAVGPNALSIPPLAVLDAALILEAGWDKLCDCLAFVDVPHELRLARALQRGWTEGDFAAREAAQESLDSKRARADVIIDNSGPAEHTQAQVQRLWQVLVG